MGELARAQGFLVHAHFGRVGAQAAFQAPAHVCVDTLIASGAFCGVVDLFTFKCVDGPVQFCQQVRM